MYEYVNVSVSSHDPAALAAQLTERSADGWEVVAIVPTGTDTTAFLRRIAGSSPEATAAAPAVVETAPAPEPEPAPAPAPSPVEEPAGWGAAPEPTPASSSAPATVISTAAATPESAAPAAAATSGSTTPAGWYHDPSGRFELRYWDGGQWTEHVARGGQQYTDPPVA